MKLIILFVILLPVVISRRSGLAARCYEPMREGGPCLGHIVSFYYHPYHKTCLRFIYSGCNGNNNRFRSREDCMSECGEEDPEESEEEEEEEDECLQPVAEGLCHNEIMKWYFDRRSKTCKTFTYTGCFGNKNNFASYNQCVSRCLGYTSRLRVTTPNEDRYLEVTAKRNRWSTASALSRQLSSATGTTVSRQTVYRRLGHIGLYARRPVRCVPLSVTHCRLRLTWSREHALWTPQQWSCVMFSDESRFSPV
ncbi:HTH_Tnp_Tc3_2 domain-containing protein [Trichonephila clavipes]|nr:HTH_Tnp_Tc3_2 domain-containing protein [Trichonephila clavipes]